MTVYTVKELADLVAGECDGDEGRQVSGVAPVDRAGPDDVTFVVSQKYASRLAPDRVGACLIPPDVRPPGSGPAYIRVENPELAFSRLLELFHPSPEPEPGVHPTVVLGPGVQLGADVWLGPYVTVEREVRVGAGTQVGPHSHIGVGATVGTGCRIGPSCTIHRGVLVGNRVRMHAGVRVGVDGFGFARGPDGLARIPQVGGCVIGDDVEIGANSTVDRGSLGDTVIGCGTKIDNLVHVAHNVQVGDHCILVAQVGVAGSVRIGDGAQLAGQVGVAGHLTIGPGARIGAQAGVIGDVPAGAVYSGYPARPHRQSLRASAAALQLPDLSRRIAELERRLEAEGR